MPVKSKVKISQNFVASSEYMNFNVDFRQLWFYFVIGTLAEFFMSQGLGPFLPYTKVTNIMNVEAILQ